MGGCVVSPLETKQRKEGSVDGKPGQLSVKYKHSVGIIVSNYWKLCTYFQGEKTYLLEDEIGSREYFNSQTKGQVLSSFWGPC